MGNPSLCWATGANAGGAAGGRQPFDTPTGNGYNAEGESVIVSYDFRAGRKTSLPDDLVNPVLCKGAPKEADFEALDNLADAIADRHKERHLQ